MKKVIIICNTYYQLIAAIQIKLTIKKNEHVSVIISDHSNNAYLVYKRLLNEHVFNDLYFVKTKKVCEDQAFFLKSVKGAKEAICGRGSIFDFLPRNEKYDEFLFYNYDIATHCLFAHIERYNSNVDVSKYEEGILSYNMDEVCFKKIYAIREKMGHGNLYPSVRKFYCFYPDLYSGRLEAIGIPLIASESNKLKKIVENIFSINTQTLIYKQKYIYFSGVYDFEGGESINELKFIQKLAELVGIENLLIKAHPRDNVQRFEEIGVQVDKMSEAPWEAVFLNYDFSDKVFLTIISGSVINLNLMYRCSPKTFLLYKLFGDKNNNSMTRCIKMFENIYKTGKINNCEVIRDLDEILKYEDKIFEIIT